MERTKFPVKSESEVQNFTFDEITEGLTKTEIASLLEDQTEVNNRLWNQKRDAYFIGEILYRNKLKLGHGKFMSWVKLAYDNDLPYPTAHFYMRVYDVFKDHQDTIQYIPSKYLMMVTGREFPKEVVALLNENPDKIERKGLQQINEVYKEFKEGKIGSNQFLKLAEKQIKLGIDIYKGSSRHRINTNMRRSLELGISDIMDRINDMRKRAREMANLYPYDPNSADHKRLISKINDTMYGLRKLKIDLEGGDGFFKSISTEEGNKEISNL